MEEAVDKSAMVSSGLKRERAFALASQAQFAFFPGRTRSRRTLVFDHSSPSPPTAAATDRSRPKNRRKNYSDLSGGYRWETPPEASVNNVGLNAGSSSWTGDQKTEQKKISKKINPAKTRQGRLTKKNLGLHKLVFMKEILPEGTEVGYFLHGKELLKGYIKDSGIHCGCCKEIISPSQFESHAGQASRRKPYNNIYTSNGVSLHELAVSIRKDKNITEKKSDDLCSSCIRGGGLLNCDLCPRAFHPGCIGMSILPEGEWHCSYCVSLHQRESYVARNENAIAAGRVRGVDPIQQIFKRCIRIVQTSETEAEVCALCKLRTFTQTGFNDQTVMICDQCEKEYHVGCLRNCKIADLKELPKQDWFCCSDCSRIGASLEEFVLSGDQAVTLSLVDTDDDSGIKWRLIRGKTAAPDMKFLLDQAVDILHCSFEPIVDVSSGRDLIPDMVHGIQEADSDYRGMYCALLSVGSSVVSTGVIRVLGSSLAELPLVATRSEHRGHGYCQLLFSCIERLLRRLAVEHFVLPACEVAEPMWTEKYGFKKVTSEELGKYANGSILTSFVGSSILHKPFNSLS